MLTEKIFIRYDNTLIDDLIKLGYKCKDIHKVARFIECNMGIFRITDNPNYNFIYCGINKKLFLAIAAINDENDYMQWFVTEADRFWFNIGVYSYKGSLEQCLIKHRYPKNFIGKEMYCNSIVPAHKASVRELINKL